MDNIALLVSLAVVGILLLVYFLKSAAQEAPPQQMHPKKTDELVEETEL